MVQPHPMDAKRRYYRPFVSNDPHRKHEVFLVGINPATPISETDLSLSEYIQLLTNEDAFYGKYEELRRAQGKPAVSRTRGGINNFVKEIQIQSGKAVLETNAIPYPTPNVKELKKTPRDVIEKAEAIFYRLLMEQTPNVLLVHGKMSLKCLVNALASHQLLDDSTIDLDQPLKTIEAKAPFVEFTYPNGNKGAIFACRHFMYYGKTGESFADFRCNVIHYLNDKPVP
ncbi:hypothetical protein [Aureibacillus halotolerans]|uniref:Uncharacterized protein n=1 Tax=Aureibacillus halotolerans TaxID=1508390 RepID=A0A4R6TWV1_9BACI|nr:hypothetical protein [Aureibacillus halotolerans]TDQ33428.1 hypothetical protein EV213_1311 [Aureibacillus halotolerans]